MRLFSKEEIMSLQNNVNNLNKEYDKKISNGNLNVEIYTEKIKALNNLNKIISSKKYR